MALEYRLKPEEFGWLSQLFEDAAPISPLTLFADKKASFGVDNKNHLITQGIIDADGNLAAQPYTVFKSLAEAKAYTRVRIIGVDAPIDKIIYTDGTMRCSVDAGPDSLSVTYPPVDETVGYTFSEYTGTSRFINVPFSVKLPLDTARTFFLALDVVRQRNLVLLTRTKAPLAFTASDLMAEQNALHTMFHTSAVLESLVGPSKLTAADLETGLEALLASGLVMKTAEGWLFTDSAMALAMQMLIPEYHFNITHGTVESTTSVVKSECYVSLFGIHDLLYIDQDDGDIVIETMSGSDLYLILMNALL